ncbi:hypothetical protein EYS14_10875 [Alteromonadaceae bacterium M269]|nr:hypothetical protein EYS14_10875 [Alteromonadaceae bacterium M269]
MEIDYTKYTLQELEDISKHIDRSKYPERFEKVNELINERLSSTDKTTEDESYIEERLGFGSKKGCEKIIQYGFFAGLFVTIMSFVTAFFPIYDDIELALFEEFGISIIVINIAVLAFLTFFISKRSRAAATIMFLYYSFSVLRVWFVELEVRGVLLSLFLMAVFVNATIATFIWHSRHKNVPITETE